MFLLFRLELKIRYREDEIFKKIYSILDLAFLPVDRTNKDLNFLLATIPQGGDERFKYFNLHT